MTAGNERVTAGNERVTADLSDIAGPWYLLINTKKLKELEA